MKEYLNLSKELIKEIQNLEYNPTATCRYDLLSGGLVWEDEISNYAMFKMLEEGNYIFRFVLAYRVSMILGEQNATCKDAWEYWAELFPTWPGFREERINGNLKNFLLQEQKKHLDDSETDII